METDNDRLTKKEAIEFLGLEDKIFENYFRSAGEFSPLPREGRGRFYFSKKALSEWLEGHKWRTATLNRDDYQLCLDFALAQHFRGYVLSDWGSARQREFGQKITNWVKGQLAEVAVKKFLKKEFGTEVELDFQIHDAIVPQDIVAVIENGNKREPKIRVGIKSSKPKSAYLVLGENEVIRDDRKSDVYLFCRPDLPDDHLLRIAREKIIEEVKNQQHFKTYEKYIPKLEPVPCEIAGFCYLDDLEKVTEIPGQDFGGTRYVCQTGKLKRSKEQWKELISKL